MLHVTDDMDELFRKAAQDYPLKTENPDWDAVRQKMEASAPRKPDKPGSYYRNLLLLFLFLLIPLHILFNGILDTHVTGFAREGIAGAHDKVFGIGNSNSVHAVDNISQIAGTGPGNGRTYSTVKNSHNVKLKSVSSNTSGSFKASHKRVSDKNEIVGNDKIRKGKRPSSTSSRTNIAISSPVQEEDETAGISNPGEISAIVNNIFPEEPTKKSEQITEKKKVVAPASSEKKEEKNKRATKHFYAGIIVGPDVTAVKMQSVKKAGISYGVVAGYRFNKRWDIETGLLADKKYYNTDGKYFNTKDIPLPSYVKINHAEGDCDMMEIPLNVRYNFRKRSGSGWFGSAGVSSYLMTKEYYDYDVTRYGVSYARSFTYYESRNSFMSVLNLSGGYSYKLGKIGDLRIEPYIKLPLKKVGIGSLPLQSAGVYVVFTKLLF